MDVNFFSHNSPLRSTANEEERFRTEFDCEVLVKTQFQCFSNRKIPSVDTIIVVKVFIFENPVKR